MPEGPSSTVLQIKKYPNRRFYDATRSCHVTLADVHELVLAGHAVVVTDSRTGEDITNLILVQIMLEKDPPKLHLFPSWIFHALLRSSHSAAHSMMQHLFAPFTQVWSRGQRGFDELMHRVMTGRITTPVEWAQSMMTMFRPDVQTTNGRGEPGAPASTEPEGADHESTLEELRTQIDELNQRVQQLQEHRSRP